MSKISESSWLTRITLSDDVLNDAMDRLTLRKAGWISFQFEFHSVSVVCEGKRSIIVVIVVGWENKKKRVCSCVKRQWEKKYDKRPFVDFTCRTTNHLGKEMFKGILLLAKSDE